MTTRLTVEEIEDHTIGRQFANRLDVRVGRTEELQTHVDLPLPDDPACIGCLLRTS